jgi:activating signal cointegrator complex subunit 3
MLTIVNEINKNFEMGVLKKDNFKIVYVAPMKALAAEMVENFSKCLEPLGIVVKELTGDMQLTKKEVLETQILVTTPEKWGSLIVFFLRHAYYLKNLASCRLKML